MPKIDETTNMPIEVLDKMLNLEVVFKAKGFKTEFEPAVEVGQESDEGGADGSE